MRTAGWMLLHAATHRSSSRLKVHTLCSYQSAQETIASTASRRDTTGDEAVIVESQALIREYLHRAVDA
jgi:hypothetical protein